MPPRKEDLTRRAGADDAGRRLDKVLRRMFPSLGLSDIYGRLRKRTIRVNGARAEPACRLAEGDLISFPAELLTGGEDSTPPSEPIGSRNGSGLGGILVLETRDLLFLNKPRGLLSHGPGGLDELVEAAMRDRIGMSLSFRPGPLHRLDRNTSGLITFPRTAEGSRAFSMMLRSRRIRKRYLALLDGVLDRELLWEDRLVRDDRTRTSHAGAEAERSPDEAARGRRAVSRIVPLIGSQGLCLAMIEIQTGLTHQIRAQASLHGRPLAGDRKYGGSRHASGFLLHAHSMEFSEPPFDDVPRRVIASLPSEASERLASIFGPNEVEKAQSLALMS
ncbi:MAG TPA: RluA family pseudouridine synthase [Rectinemataceae bacterium]|nr:RluA family pseudouridine synthase [Rectinemataceae bacterium]